MKRALVVVVLAGSAWASRAPAQEAYGLPLRGEAAEAFLRTAEFVSKKGIKTGITHPDQYTLTDGTKTCRAAWKTIDEFKRGITSLEGGGVIVDFADSYKHEIAAYELDKLIGLDLVPPTVERTFGGRKGSLQLWVEGAMTEAERKKKKITPPDPQAWNEQMYKVRLLHQLTDNTDFRNINNVLSDPSFRVYAVDCSRGFTIYDGPARPEGAGPLLPLRARGPEGPRPAHPRGEARALARRPPDRRPAEAAGQDRGTRGEARRRARGRRPSSTDGRPRARCPLGPPSSAVTFRRSSSPSATGGIVVCGRAARGLRSQSARAFSVHARSPGAVGG